MNQKWILAAVAALVVGAFAVIPGTASADETCSSGHVCVWTEQSFQGAKGESLCTGGAHVLGGTKFSAKNRCANKASWLRMNGNTWNCLNPGENGSNLFNFNEVWIGAEGSRC